VYRDEVIKVVDPLTVMLGTKEGTPSYKVSPQLPIFL
jgi:hypothetical protein